MCIVIWETAQICLIFVPEMYDFKVGPDRPKKRFSGPNSAGLFRTRLKQPRSVPRCGARYEEAKKTGGPFFRWVLSSTPRGLSTLGYSGVPKAYQRVGKASTTSWRASQPNPGHPLVACNRLKFKGGAPDRFWGGLSTPGVLESTQIYEWSPTTTPHPNRNLLPPSPR